MKDVFSIPPKMNEPPLKRNRFKRKFMKFHLPSHQFSGDTLVFRGYGTSSALPLSWTAPASAAGCQLQPANEMTSTSTARWVMLHQSDWGKHCFLMSSYSFRMMKASRTRMMMMMNDDHHHPNHLWQWQQLAISTVSSTQYLPTKYTHSLLHEQHLNNNPKSVTCTHHRK